ncbi:hypothetical protein LY78DRAFT_114614 [Colletotrichum sublineola]|nr:hypothetical protein LY78DRAFT_114614 [Colletotrichum sublineola]
MHRALATTILALYFDKPIEIHPPGEGSFTEAWFLSKRHLVTRPKVSNLRIVLAPSLLFRTIVIIAVGKGRFDVSRAMPEDSFGIPVLGQKEEKSKN